MNNTPDLTPGANTLRDIAAGCGDPAGLAALALQAEEIEFSRWYA